MLTRRAKAYSSSSSQTVSLSSAFSSSSFLDYVLQQKIEKINNKQHVCAYLQPCSRYTR